MSQYLTSDTSFQILQFLIATIHIHIKGKRVSATQNMQVSCYYCFIYQIYQLYIKSYLLKKGKLFPHGLLCRMYEALKTIEMHF